MVIIKRKLWGIAPYTTAFFPTESTLDEIIAELRPFEMARLFWTPVGRQPGMNVIACESSSASCLDLSKSTDSLWKGMRRNCRYDLNRAEKLASDVRIERNGTQTKTDFLEVFNGFARVKDHVSPITSRILDNYAQHSDLFVIYLDGRPMCAHAVLRDQESSRARLLYSANRRLEDSEAASRCSALNRYLHWREIQTYRDEGFGIFDFGGIRSDAQDGISRFKISFGGAIINEFSYLCAGSPWMGRVAEKVRARLRSSAGAGPRPTPDPELGDDYRATS